jgi:hypothetical protein
LPIEYNALENLSVCFIDVVEINPIEKIEKESISRKTKFPTELIKELGRVIFCFY